MRERVGSVLEGGREGKGRLLSRRRKKEEMVERRRKVVGLGKEERSVSECDGVFREEGSRGTDRQKEGYQPIERKISWSRN